MSALVAHNPLFAPREAPSLASILALQSRMLAMPQAETGLQHHFSRGAYARELLIPADTVVVGKMHATEHFLILACGDVSITTDAGMERLQGPRVLNTMPGIKRAIYAHADSTLITIHVTTETDIDRIEAAIILPDPVLIEGELTCLG